MTLRRRVIVCLDVDGGRVVKGVSFRRLRDVGDPVELARRYEADGADEIVFLDISASAERRRTLLDVVRRTAESLFIPLTVGGGINEFADIERALRAGADKVSMNTAAVRSPALISEAATHFGSQCIVVSIDAQAAGPAQAMASAGTGTGSASGQPAATAYLVHTHGARVATDLDAVEWAAECTRRGAGEILLTSIDRDGRRIGFDLDLTRRVSRAVSVPVIASGGAGEAGHFVEAFVSAGADAALAAGIFHEGVITIAAVKRALAEAGVPVRIT